MSASCFDCGFELTYDGRCLGCELDALVLLAQEVVDADKELMDAVNSGARGRFNAAFTRRTDSIGVLAAYLHLHHPVPETAPLTVSAENSATIGPRGDST